MPFPTVPNMTPETYRREIFDHYWPRLRDDLEANRFIQANDKRALVDDYAQIGSLLTHKDRVCAALEPLEQEIRERLLLLGTQYRSKFPTSSTDANKYVHKDAPSSTAAEFKAHKLLTDALRRHEAEGGFNHERIVDGTFFDDPQAGTLHAGGGMTDVSKSTMKLQAPDALPPGMKGEKANTVKLPRGVPTIVGSLDPSAFNSVLLRHGYQFKDVAAGPYHGEYTHRLQWHAIMRARASGAITLVNEPLQIYRSFGYMVAKAPGNTDNPAKTAGNREFLIDAKGNHRHLYLWEALFDTAEGLIRAENLRTLAYTESGMVFTCPESMNKSLMKLDGYTDRPEDLWCLRVLLATRWKKRYDASLGKRKGLGGFEKLQDRLDWDETRAVVSSVSRKEVTFKPPVQTGKKFEIKPPTGNGPTLSLQEQLEAKRQAVKNAGQRAHVVPEQRIEQDLQFGDVLTAGYALAWYMQDDRVR